MIRLRIALQTSLLLLCSVFVPATEAATVSKKAPAPVIENFTLDPANRTTPGTEISFVVEGTPRGKVSVRISGVSRAITLTEVDPGVYEGSYTVRSSDKIAPKASTRATLTRSGRSAIATAALDAADTAAPTATAPAPTAPAVGAPQIERLNVAPVDKLDPGVDLKFTLVGTPGAHAVLAIEGVVRDINMKEVKPGQYEASYTVRRLDHFPASGNIFATLEAGGLVTRTRLNQSLLVAAKPPVLKNMLPKEGETIAQGPTNISATFDDTGGVAIDPKSVRVLFDGRDVTQNAAITPQFFTYRIAPAPGSHQVQVTAQDMTGNAVRYAWNFTVGPNVAGVPIGITSHQNNAQVSGGATEVRGRTAPNAQVDVKVSQVASVAGLFGVNQELLSQTVRADGSGNFMFRFQPQINVPGSRYEISLKARTDQAQSRDMQLVLFQQK